MKRKTAIVKHATFNQANFHEICEELTSRDNDLKAILHTYGYPPMWTRENSFSSLVHIILEQQVSLASALATLNKLKAYTIKLTPEAVLNLSDEEMRACYVSRQKAGYIKGLAQALQDGTINLNELEELPDEDVRSKLSALKGIGNWTVDVYLMFVLQRADIFPIGDLAAINALKRLKGLTSSTTRATMLEISDQWKPFRSVASMMLWHYYLSNNTKKASSPNSD